MNSSRREPPVKAADLKKVDCFAFFSMIFSALVPIQIDKPNTAAIARKLRTNTATFSQLNSTTVRRSNQSWTDSLLQSAHSTAITEKVPAARSAWAAMSETTLEGCPNTRFLPFLATCSVLATTKKARIDQNRMSVAANRNEPRSQNHWYA